MSVRTRIDENAASVPERFDAVARYISKTYQFCERPSGTFMMKYS
jgi:hypothetical protein